ncbi:MAG TPA: hypothetical protein VLB69_11070 [Rudaea sp.]|nr:hypothetical protein [Rudaea sp.]
MAALLGGPLAAAAGTWQPLNHQPPLPQIVVDTTGYAGGAAFPILLTDGSVIVQNNGMAADGSIWKLTPDLDGSYVNGTWSQLASMPYIPTAAAQAVLADGRVLIEGGEYTGPLFDFTLTNQGAIYDPVLNIWTPVLPPAFFVDLYPPRAAFAPHPIGDAASTVLADGTFMLQDKMSRQAALLDLGTMTWTETGTDSKADLNDEEGLTLLPDGRVLTVDAYTDYAFGLIASYPTDPTNSELYDPTTGAWSSAGSTVNTLTDPNLFEMGPAVLRPDGTVFAVGSQGYTAIYDTSSGQWAAGPRLPMSPQGNQYVVQDGPGALLPNGNVLIAASGGAPNPGNGGYSDPPLAFFEFDGQHVTAQPTIPNGPNDWSFSPTLLVLPTGQVLEADSSGDVEIYTPDDLGHDPAWEPVVSVAPTVVVPGGSYVLAGVRFNGMSQATMYGDEGQNATNYPIVRITNLATSHVFYSRTHDHSSMAVASPLEVTTHFDVPPAQELGPSQLEVVANGIASSPVSIIVATDAIFANDFDPPP